MYDYASIFLSMHTYMSVVKNDLCLGTTMWIGKDICRAPAGALQISCLGMILSSDCKENLEAKVEILTNKSSKTTQPGPVLDCIVFHDGHSWRFVFVLTDANLKFM